MAGSLTWLGHAAFRLDTPGGKRIYVDPFLNGNPKCPQSELEPERVDVIAVTHGHGDHVGDTVDLAKKHSCPVVDRIAAALGIRDVTLLTMYAEPPVQRSATAVLDGVTEPFRRSRLTDDACVDRLAPRAQR